LKILFWGSATVQKPFDHIAIANPSIPTAVLAATPWDARHPQLSQQVLLINTYKAVP